MSARDTSLRRLSAKGLILTQEERQLSLRLATGSAPLDSWYSPAQGEEGLLEAFRRLQALPLAGPPPIELEDFSLACGVARCPGGTPLRDFPALLFAPQKCPLVHEVHSAWLELLRDGRPRGAFTWYLLLFPHFFASLILSLLGYEEVRAIPQETLGDTLAQSLISLDTLPRGSYNIPFLELLMRLRIQGLETPSLGPLLPELQGIPQKAPRSYPLEVVRLLASELSQGPGGHWRALGVTARTWEGYLAALDRGLDACDDPLLREYRAHVAQTLEEGPPPASTLAELLGPSTGFRCFARASERLILRRHLSLGAPLEVLGRALIHSSTIARGEGLWAEVLGYQETPLLWNLPQGLWEPLVEFPREEPFEHLGHPHP